MKTIKNNRDKSTKISIFESFAGKVSKQAGSTYAFSLALLAVLVWAVSGPFFNYSEEWQLVINTGTTIITFLMVFLIQKAQNKDSLAIHLKLNELIASHRSSSNRLVNIENMSEEEMQIVQKYYRELNNKCLERNDLENSHSVEESYEKDR